jgi:hypothetical protein
MAERAQAFETKAASKAKAAVQELRGGSEMPLTRAGWYH